MAELLKLCSCGRQNPETAFFCDACNADLSDVAASLADSPVPMPAPGGEEVSAGTKRCPKCGTANESYRTLCNSCGEELEAEGAPARPGGRVDTLTLIAGAAQFPLQPGDVLGREGTVAYEVFGAAGDTVSRQHVIVSRSPEGWMICIPSRVRNITQLDGKELPRDTEVPVVVGEHILQLSTKCRVLLRVAAT